MNNSLKTVEQLDDNTLIGQLRYIYSIFIYIHKLLAVSSPLYIEKSYYIRKEHAYWAMMSQENYDYLINHFICILTELDYRELKYTPIDPMVLYLNVFKSEPFTEMIDNFPQYIMGNNYEEKSLNFYRLYLFMHDRVICKWTKRPTLKK